jgi:serine O-acetyltransferase
MCKALTALGSDYCAKDLPVLRDEDFAGVKPEGGAAAVDGVAPAAPRAND